MVIKIKKGFLAFLAVVFAAVLCAVGAFCFIFARSSAFAEETAEEIAVASVTFGDKTTSYTTVKAAFDQANGYKGTTKENPAVITLIADREAEENLQLTVESGQFLTLDLNGHMLKLTGTNTSSPISVSGTFMLRDRQPNTEHKYNVGENGLYVFDENGTQIIRGGVITGGDINTGNVDGGCVNVSGNNASFIMTGGNIAGNKVQGNGGAISVNKNTFIMEGGAIAGNVSVGGNGGGVYLTSGTFTMTGGEIENNYCGKLGGGVYSTSTFIMEGGTISGNSSGRHGGGIYNSSSFTLKGGTISGNSTTDDKRYGGGVFNAGTFTVSGAPVITGNSKPAGSNSVANNLYLENSTTINVDGLLETTDPAASAQINLTVNGTLNIAGYTESGNTGSPSKYFAFDNGKCIQLSADGTLNAEQPSHTVNESVWEKDTAGHWNECDVCHAKVNYAVHVGNEASCTEAGNCTVCHREYGPNGHKFVHHAAVAATCTAKGYKEYWYCSVCDKNYSNGDKFSVSLLEGDITTSIDDENHNKATAWTNGGAEGHYHVCENGCGEKLDLTEHDKAGADGACSYCGYKTSETHTHDFSGEYVTNATQHWKVCKDCAEADTKTAHVYDKEIVDAKYLKSAADCSEAAVYYKSCVCGQKGTETFNSGSANGQHDITSIVITTQPTKKSYTALETFDTAGMVVKTHCSNCNQDIEEIEAKDYTVVYYSSDERLHADDDSIDIEYGTLTATVTGLAVAKKQMQVVWQYTKSTSTPSWGDWVSEFVYDPDDEDLNTRLRATFDNGKSEYRASDRLVTINKNGMQISSTSIIKNAGTFTLALDETAAEFADYSFTNNSATLTIDPLTIELSSKTEETDFYWLLSVYDSALQDGYIDKEYNYHSAEGEDTTYVKRSIVRNRNKKVQIKLFGVRSTDNLGEEDGVYVITYEGGNTGKDLGKYTAQAVMTLTTNNYVFSVGAFSAARDMTAELQENGTVLITKVWYIANMGNALLSQDDKHGTYGQDWDISDWTYGAYVPQMAPRLEHGDPGTYGNIKVFAQDDTLVTFKLFREESASNGVKRVPIGTTFNRYAFNTYINGSVPAGSYILEVHVDKYTSIEHEHWYDGTQHDGQAAGIFYDEFNVEYRFRVAKAQFSATNTNLSSLENKTFRYTYDEQLHFYDSTFVLEARVRAVRSGIWTDAAYDTYYGKAHLHYKLERWNTEAFLDEQEIASFVNERQKPQGADTYKIYYQLYANNYEELNGDNYYFTVIIGKMGINKPSDMTEAYSGSANTYTISEYALYRVTGKASYTNAGSYDITLTLKDSINYAWKNEDGTLSSSGTTTVKMVITKAQITVPANTTAQLNGKYVYEVSEYALYTLEGNSEFSEAGDYDITLKLKDSVNYEWKTAEGEAVSGATVTVKLHLGDPAQTPAESEGTGAPDVWLVLSIIMSVIIAGEVAYIAYRLLRKNKNTEGEE